MLDELRFGEHRTSTAGSEHVGDRHNQMDEKKRRVARSPDSRPSVQPFTSLGFCLDLRYELQIRYQQVTTKMTAKRIVILGGGFGGAFTAKYLRRCVDSEVTIELINDANYFVFQPLLPEVVAGIITASDAVTPLRVMLPGVKFRMAHAYGVDFAKQQVHVVQGTRRVPIQVAYDQLVIAVGQITNLEMLPGFAEHSLTMRNLSDAYVLRNHVIQCLEHADVTEDEALKQRLLTFVVAGGGFSGIETIGELVEMIRRTLRYYPNIEPHEIRPILVQRYSRILPELPERLSEYARRKLERRGIEIKLNSGLVSATATSVQLDDGSAVEAGTIVSTIGNGPSELVRALDIELIRGKIPTNRYLNMAGHDNVWAVGDAALIALDDDAEQFAPPTAQFATAQAQRAAKNLAATLANQPLVPFTFRPKGALASIGHYSAVAEVFGVRVSGLLAWFMWRGFYILRLPGFATKVRVTLNWLFDYMLPRNIVQNRNDRLPATRFVRLKKGDVLFNAGQILDGFYTVVEGALESRIPDAVLGEDFIRVLRPGDHWGERALTEDWQTQGSLTAVEDSRVLILKRDDFTNLRTSLPVLDEYFKHIPEKLYAHPLRRDRGNQGVTR